MKKIKFLILILFGVNGYAQYAPFLVDSAKWSINRYYINFTEAREFAVVGDTLIGSIVFSKVKNSITTAPLSQIDSALLFEDSAQKKVFMYNISDQTLDLLYDFNLNIGDSVYLKFKYLQYDTQLFIVDSVFFITSIDSVQRKVLLLRNYPPTVQIGNYLNNIIFNTTGLVWIEGLGASNCPIYTITFNPNTIPYYDFVTCVFGLGGLKYQVDASFNCSIISGLLKEEQMNQDIVYPNPFIDFINVSIPGNDEVLISIIDSNGIVRYSCILNGKSIRIEHLDQLCSGLFILEINNLGKKSITRHKIFKL